MQPKRIPLVTGMESLLHCRKYCDVLRPCACTSVSIATVENQIEDERGALDRGQMGDGFPLAILLAACIDF